MSTLGWPLQRPQTDHNYILVVWTKNSTEPTLNISHLLPDMTQMIKIASCSLSSGVQAISIPLSPYSRPFYARLSPESLVWQVTWEKRTGHMWTGCEESAFPAQVPCLTPQNEAGRSSFGWAAQTATPTPWLSAGRCRLFLTTGRHVVWGSRGQLGQKVLEAIWLPIKCMYQSSNYQNEVDTFLSTCLAAVLSGQRE